MNSFIHASQVNTFLELEEREIGVEEWKQAGLIGSIKSWTK
jgi:hypothetical protein